VREMVDKKSNHFCPWMWVTASVKGWRRKTEWWGQRDWTEDHWWGGRRPSISHPVLVNVGASTTLFIPAKVFHTQVSKDLFFFQQPVLKGSNSMRGERSRALCSLCVEIITVRFRSPAFTLKVSRGM
jgi:hypothetical protein